MTNGGTYLIDAVIEPEDPAQFTVAVNGDLTSAVFGGENGPFSTGISGQTIFTLAAGDVVTLENTSSYSEYLNTYADGSGTPEDASLVIEQLG